MTYRNHTVAPQDPPIGMQSSPSAEKLAHPVYSSRRDPFGELDWNITKFRYLNCRSALLDENIPPQ